MTWPTFRPLSVISAPSWDAHQRWPSAHPAASFCWIQEAQRLRETRTYSHAAIQRSQMDLKSCQRPRTATMPRKMQRHFVKQKEEPENTSLQLIKTKVAPRPRQLMLDPMPGLCMPNLSAKPTCCHLQHKPQCQESQQCPSHWQMQHHNRRSRYKKSHTRRSGLHRSRFAEI